MVVGSFGVFLRRVILVWHLGQEKERKVPQPMGPQDLEVEVSEGSKWRMEEQHGQVVMESLLRMVIIFGS